MASQVSDYVLERVREWGIHRIYGYPGDGINGLLGAFGRAGGDPEMAAFTACGHAKFTGEVGCCTATSGPGAIHLLNGLYDAKLDHQPVVGDCAFHVNGMNEMIAKRGVVQKAVEFLEKLPGHGGDQ